jgi:hypothetical protein
MSYLYSPNVNATIVNSNGNAGANAAANVRIADGVQVDTLSRIRTSIVQYQSQHVPSIESDSNLVFSQNVNGTGANTTFNANTSEVNLYSGTTSGGFAYRQTRTKYKIIPGSSHSAYFTVNFDGATSGCTKRIGLFNTSHGMFWELDNSGNLNVVVRKASSTGSIYDDRVASTAFNIDKLDGTGPSKFNISTAGLDKYYTFWFDFVGGRTGRIRFGMGTPSGAQIVHQFSYAGTNTTPSITSTSLPIRVEVYNNTVQGSSPSIQMAGQVFNQESAKRFQGSIATGNSVVGWASTATLQPLLGVSLRPTAPFNQQDIQMESFTVQDLNNLDSKNNTNGVYYYEWRLNPTIGGTLPTAINAGKASQYLPYVSGTNTVSGGLILKSGIFTSAQQVLQLGNLAENLNFGADINDVPDLLVLCIKTFQVGTAAGSMVAAVNWTEEL